jgi:hypothetical protein
MTDQQGYNGWKNYETWSVALIVDNDEGTYNERRALVAELVEAAREEDVPEWSSVEDHVRWRVADGLKAWIEDAVPDYTERTPGYFEAAGGPLSYLWAQLLSAALSEVDWSELADAWIEEGAEE